MYLNENEEHIYMDLKFQRSFPYKWKSRHTRYIDIEFKLNIVNTTSKPQELEQPKDREFRKPT